MILKHITNSLSFYKGDNNGLMASALAQQFYCTLQSIPGDGVLYKGLHGKAPSQGSKLPLSYTFLQKQGTHISVKYPLKNTASLISKILGIKLMNNILGENQALPDTVIRFVCPFEIKLRE